jgi:hypothetical protein
MHNKLLLALISMIRLLGLILTTPARAACAALCDDVTLRSYWVNIAVESPWLRSILSGHRLRAFTPVFARIPREHPGWHPPLPTREVTFFPLRLK